MKRDKTNHQISACRAERQILEKLRHVRESLNQSELTEFLFNRPANLEWHKIIFLLLIFGTLLNGILKKKKGKGDLYLFSLIFFKIFLKYFY